MLKYDTFRSAIKYEIAPQIPNYKKKILLVFFLPSIRMSVKNINFEDKKIKKVISTKTEKYSRQMKLMLIKYQFQKQNYMIQISRLNISLNIMMMMMMLDHYV